MLSLGALLPHTPGAIALAVAAGATVSDWRSEGIPNGLTYPLILIGLAWGLVDGRFLDHVLGFLGTALLTVAVYRRSGIGGGALKLLVGTGALLTVWAVPAFVVAAATVGIMHLQRARTNEPRPDDSTGRAPSWVPVAPGVLVGVIAVVLFQAWRATR